MPNPTKDQLFLDYALDNEQQATISLFDLNGRIVKQDKLTGNGKLQWLVDTLPSGFYYYQIQQNNETTITNKVIIIK
ncbi:MAG: T9SS type A sorting domain-containing protein [Sphingobacteriales bacterium]|nr:T9SS type A sorting domain-containing protein [Sphingobacteriales bacterium]